MSRSVSRTFRLPKKLDDLVEAHAVAAAGPTGKPNRSRSLCAMLELSQQNAHSLRHDLYTPLGVLGLALTVIEASTKQPDALDGAEKAKRAVREINLRLARTGAA